MRFKQFLLACGIAAAALLTGCAHPISVTADLAQVKGNGQRIDKTVGYYVSNDDRQRQVTTAGGGGDKVSYFPYRDLEPAIFVAMSETFKNVVKLDSANDTQRIERDGVQLVITPRITTNSSSDSLLTWPPTQFSIDLVCRITDKNGTLLKELSVNGSGAASFTEFTAARDFSLSAKRAAQDTATKLAKALAEEPTLRR